MNHNLYSLLQQRFPQDPNALWIETPGGQKWTYTDVDIMSARYAGALRSLDVTPGDRVLVQVDKSPYALLLYLATLRIGAIFVPLNTAYTPTEVTYFLGDARPRLFIARPETEDDLVDIA
ncbi:MAG: AMP-binding protein, partial [Pseudomonadota bacterium]